MSVHDLDAGTWLLDGGKARAERDRKCDSWASSNVTHPEASINRRSVKQIDNRVNLRKEDQFYVA
jgi:hypothetical protein